MKHEDAEGFLFKGLRYFRLPRLGGGSAVPTDWSHWTQHGTVEIICLSGRGHAAVAVAFAGKMAATGFYPTLVAEQIFEGKFDADFGESVSVYGVPRELRFWNDRATGTTLNLPVEPTLLWPLSGR